jgi:hypothetical protein
MNEILKYSKNKLLVIAFGNWAYKLIALNWALHLEKLKIENYTVICLDEKLKDFLSKKGINSFYIGDEKKFNPKEWGARLNSVRDVLSSGIDIVHSDLDAVWLKNPLGYLESDHDIVASTGTFPPSTQKKWGFTLCMGWMFYKSNQNVLSLFDEILKIPQPFHDQQELNNLIASKASKDDILNLSPDIHEIKLPGLKIKVLGQNIISRGHDTNSFVCHPLTPGSADREGLFKKLGLWI